MWRGERSKTPDNSADVLDEYRSIPQAPRGPKPKIDVMNSIKNMPPITPLMQRLGINPEDNSDGEF
ncbi:MAG: hypothetical protein JW769_05275 [Parachlamydiales bacterium]|nr:hypothetical protein [Parachlamydiales bacterium]